MITRRNLNPLYELVAEATKIDEAAVKSVIKHQFSFLRKTMLSDIETEKVGILLHNLGRFNYKRSAMNTMILRDIIPQLRDPEISPEDLEALQEEFRRVWAARRNYLNWHVKKRKHNRKLTWMIKTGQLD